MIFVDSQTSERSGTNMMVPFPSESRGRKEPYPVPWGGMEPLVAPGPGLALGYDTFHFLPTFEVIIMDLQLKRKIVIVTGSADGIGFKSVKLLAGEGASVVLADIAEQKNQAVAAELSKLGFDVLPVDVDVQDEASVAEMVRKTVEHYGRIDILVNNAGIGIFKGLEDESLLMLTVVS